MKETEITVEVFDSVNDTIKKLISNGFEIIEKFDMIDYYFSKETTQTLLTLDYKQLINKSFLVRKMLTEKPYSQLMYKSKEMDSNGNVIAEEKIKSLIDNPEKTIKILKLAGLNMWCEITQNMYVFSKDKIQFALQIVDNLGSFIEYEEQDWMSHLSEHEKIKAMLSDLKDTGLKLGTDYSCKKVYMKFKKENLK